jgi:RNA polymerase sigma-70 factor, ECF subfamily
VHEEAERAALAQARKGDPEAFAMLVECYSPRLFNVCFTYLANRQDAEDCVQETLIKAYRGLADYSGRSTFYTWVYRIAINTCLDYRRKNKRNPSLSLDEAIETDDSQVFQQVPDRRPLPDELAETAELTRLIRQEIANLPDYLKDIIILRDLEGLSYQELSDILHLSEGTVKSRLSRARRQLMELIRKREQSASLSRLTSKSS